MYSAINYQTHDKKLDDVLFEVALQPVYSEIKPRNSLFNRPIGTRNYLAVVNQRDGNIVSIVGKNYKLITNREALAMGKKLFGLLYPFVQPDDLMPFKVITPQTFGSAQIDLIHRDVNFRVFNQEAWLPFMRVYNSYNRAYPLSFEIGFVRELCSNGMLFRKRTMTITYPHAKQQKINLEANAAQIRSSQEIFRDQCRQLFEITIPEGHLFPLVCHILNLNVEIPGRHETAQRFTRLESLIETVNKLKDRYSGPKAPNGYDALNILTDLVSHQDEYKNLAGYYLNTRAWYQKPSVMVDTLLGLRDAGKHDLSGLLAPTMAKLRALQDHCGVDWAYN